MGGSRVPSADSTNNRLDIEVIGNKADAAVQAKGNTASVVAYLKGILDLLYGTTGIAAFPSSAAPANGVSLAEVLRQVYDQTGIGSMFWLKKTLVSSAITQAGVDVTGASAGGEIAIEDVILKTDATGLAAGTDLTLGTDNANGIAVFMTTAIAGLGANKTVDWTNASVSKHRTVLESGKKVVAKMTDADGTGAGTVDVYILCRRLAAAASLAAA